MALEVSPGRFERTAGEPCPRGSVTEPGTIPCRGVLEAVHQFQRNETAFQCDQCGYIFPPTFRPGQMSKEDKFGKAPHWTSIPDRLVEALAKSNWDRRQAREFPDPKNRTPWAEALEDHVKHLQEARETLAPVWSEFGAWFEEFLGISDQDAEAEKTARMMIEEVAIPTLKRYEERFDTPDTPRLALEASLNKRKEIA